MFGRLKWKTSSNLHTANTTNPTRMWQPVINAKSLSWVCGKGVMIMYKCLNYLLGIDRVLVSSDARVWRSIKVYPVFPGLWGVLKRRSYGFYLLCTGLQRYNKGWMKLKWSSAKPDVPQFGRGHVLTVYPTEVALMEESFLLIIAAHSTWPVATNDSCIKFCRRFIII